MIRKPSSKLLGALQSNSEVLARLTSDFRHQLPRYQIVSFYERKPLGIFKKEVRALLNFLLLSKLKTPFQIVEKQSALLEVAGEDQIPVHAHHREMCRFRGRDGDYEKLFKRIRRMLEVKDGSTRNVSGT